MGTVRYRYPSGMVVTFERDQYGNLRAVGYDAKEWGKGGTSATPVGRVSPFVRRAQAGALPPKALG